jgi:hypothetical protein
LHRSDTPIKELRFPVRSENAEFPYCHAKWSIQVTAKANSTGFLKLVETPIRPSVKHRPANFFRLQGFALAGNLLAMKGTLL